MGSCSAACVSGKTKTPLGVAYDRYEYSIRLVLALRTLKYTPEADRLVREWKKAKIRVGPHDLRIGAICVSHGATLVTNNRRDFASIPGLTVEEWR